MDVKALPDAKGDAAPPGGMGPLAGLGAIEIVATLPGASEGPLWVAAKNAVLIADREKNVVYLFDPATKALTPFRKESNGTVGNALDPQGRLVSAEQAAGSAASGRPGRSLVRSSGTGIDGVPELFIDRFPGGNGAPPGKFNRPNDLVIRKDGVIYFTDPFYEGNANTDLGDKFQGVFRASADGKTVTAEAWLKDKPNGVELSPDAKILYVATRTPNVITKFAVNADGSLGPPTKFAETSGYVDGMGIDDQGNVWACLPQGGIRVLRPSGEAWGNVPALTGATNVTFGDADRKTLYIAAGNTLRKLHVAVAGLP